MLNPFPVIVFNIGWSGLNRIPHSEAPLCFVVNPCLSRPKVCTVLNWKCKRKFRQDGMLHKMYLDQDSWDYPNVYKKLCFFHALSTNRHLKQEECLLLLVVVSMTSPSNRYWCPKCKVVWWDSAFLRYGPCSKEVTVSADVYTTIQSSIQWNINSNITR